MQFCGKTKICYGQSALEVLASLPVKKAFIVTDAVMVKVGFVDRVKTHLDLAGIGHGVFAEVEPDPSLATVTKASLLFAREKADCIIALGGGSPIDAAKAVAYFACKASGTKPCLVAIPTTSGTGSEVTAISVVTDTERELKIPLNDELLVPDVALLDPRFTRTLPPSVTAASGMDVLTHAIEAYTSRQANAFTDIHAEHAARHVFACLLRAYRCMDDMEARERMMLGSCMAGMAFNNSGLGLAHSIAHSLGGHFHIPHGVANAVLLPYVMRFNAFDAGVKYRVLAEQAGLPAGTVEEGTASLIQAVRELNIAMGIPSGIRGLKVDEKEFRAFLDTAAHNALADICTEGNPRKASHGDIRMLLEQAW